MTRELYFALADIQRSNPIKDFIYGVFKGIVSKPRLLLEVFTRKHFGCRYFSISTACILAFMLALIPLGSAWLPELFPSMEWSFSGFLLHYFTWYVFLGYFIYTCFKREKEIKRIKAVFDLDYYTLSHGEIDPRILNFTYKGKKFDVRTIETIIEPGLFFIIGLLLILIGQRIGIVIFTSSIAYSISYFSAYKCGDDIIYDKIDKDIFREQWVNSYFLGMNTSETKGVHIFARRVTDDVAKEKITNAMNEEDYRLYVS